MTRSTSSDLVAQIVAAAEIDRFAWLGDMARALESIPAGEKVSIAALDLRILFRLANIRPRDDQQLQLAAADLLAVVRIAMTAAEVHAPVSR